MVGIKQTKQRDQHGHGDRVPLPCGCDAVFRERQQRGADEQEDDRHRGQQNVERDFVRRLLPLGAFDQRDHAVEERFARIGGDADNEPIGQDARAAGDAAAVAAAFADDRRTFAGDGAFVDRGDAFDDFAVAGNHVAGLDQDDIVFAQRSGRHERDGAAPWRGASSFLACTSRRVAAQRVGLGLAAAFGHRFGEVGEQHREPQPGGNAEDEPGDSWSRMRNRVNCRVQWSECCRRTR